MSQRVIIAGGGYAGLFAAARLRKYSGMKVTLIDSKDHFVQRVRMHQHLAGGAVRNLVYREILGAAGIDFIQGRIVSLQPDQQTLTLDHPDGIQVLAYDWLLYALGSRTRSMAGIPGLSAFGRTLDPGPELDRTRSTLQQLVPGSAVVVMGAGLTGLETATEIKESHPQLDVTLLCSGQAFPGYSIGADREIRRVLRELGIHLLEETRVKQIDAAAVHAADGRVIPCQLPIHCMGFDVPSLARESGIRTSATGQIQVDEYLRSLSHPQILAIGDAADLPPTFVAARRMSCASACPMGSFAADTLHRLQSGRTLIPFRFGFIGQCISLGRRAAVVQLVKPDDTPRSLYLRGKLAIWIKELICVGTVKFPIWELRWGRSLYFWLEPKGRLA